MMHTVRWMVAAVYGLGAVAASAQDIRTVYASMPFNLERERYCKRRPAFS